MEKLDPKFAKWRDENLKKNGEAPETEVKTEEETFKQKYYKNLNHPKWQRKRLEVFKRDKWKCRFCGDEELTLHVHHTEYNKNGVPWDVDKASLLTLCADCHKIVEVIKKTDPTFQANKLSKGKLESGNSVVAYKDKDSNLRFCVFTQTGELDFRIGFSATSLSKTLKELHIQLKPYKLKKHD